MQTSRLPAWELRAQFAQIGASEVMDTYIDPTRVSLRTDMVDLEAYLKRHGWKIERRNGNVYGWIKIVPIVSEAPEPVLRIVTRSDVAAVYGSR